MSEFIRLTSSDGPIAIARDAILIARPVPGGTRIVLRGSQTIVDVTDAPDVVADLLAPAPKKAAEEKPDPKKSEPEPKATK